MKKKIFVVEDELHIAELIKYNLENSSFNVKIFTNGEDLIKELSFSIPNILLLDLMLPGIDGFEICKQIRSSINTMKLPIIMITAKNEELDRILGLELGADDYITKPFSVRELVARVKAVLRRTEAPSEATNSQIFNYKDLTIDLEKHEVLKNNKLLELTFKEFELLKLFFQNKGKVLTRDILLEKVWGFEFLGETRTVDVHIRYLRQKIEDNDSDPKYIETVRGVGYKFSDK